MSYRFIGYAIVSRDGMLADAAGAIPPELIVREDQDFFMQGLDAAAAVIHGRNSAEQPTSPSRRRLIATREKLKTPRAGPLPNSLLWNPEDVPVEAALARLGVHAGDVAIIGGTDLFGRFLPLYDVFYLTRAPEVTLPEGRPVFPGVPDATPKALLTAAGLRPVAERALETGRGVSVVTWVRPSSRTASRP